MDCRCTGAGHTVDCDIRRSLEATATAIIGNADDYHCGDIGHDTFSARNRQLWDSVHHSDHDALVKIIEGREKT